MKKNKALILCLASSIFALASCGQQQAESILSSAAEQISNFDLKEYNAEEALNQLDELASQGEGYEIGFVYRTYASSTKLVESGEDYSIASTESSGGERFSFGAKGSLTWATCQDIADGSEKFGGAYDGKNYYVMESGEWKLYHDGDEQKYIDYFDQARGFIIPDDNYVDLLKNSVASSPSATAIAGRQCTKYEITTSKSGVSYNIYVIFDVATSLPLSFSCTSSSSSDTGSETKTVSVDVTSFSISPLVPSLPKE